MTTYCSCGCGQEIASGKSFVQGHWSRTKSAKDLFRSRRAHEPANPSGLCICGCGQTTPISEHNHSERGYLAGEHLKFCYGHRPHMVGSQKGSWKGGRYTHKGGYVYILVPGHPAANRDGYVYEHRLVAEWTLGRLLEPGERIHHINGIKGDNRSENLVVCQTQGQHRKIHGSQELIDYNREHPEMHLLAGLKTRFTKKP